MPKLIIVGIIVVGVAFDFLHDAFDVRVLLAVIGGLQVAAEYEGHGLPQPCGKPALELLDQVIAVAAGLPVDQLDKHFPLIDGEVLEFRAELL